MFVALNVENQHITAEQAEKEKERENAATFFCPGCRKPVFLKNGKHMQAHFAHYTQNNCSIFSEGETEEHLSGKKILFDWFKKQNIPCQLEAYLPELKQRPDLLVWTTDKHPVAIELQCSSLSIEKMIERTEGYQKNGYEVIWIAGSKFKLKKQVTPFQQLFLRNKPMLGLYFVSLNVEKKQVELYSHISLRQPGQYPKVQKQSMPLNKLKFSFGNPVKSFKYLKGQKESDFSFLKSHEYLIKGRIYQNPKMVEFQKYIYYHGQSLISLPREVYIPIKNELLIRTIPHFWKLIVLEWIEAKGVGTVFSKKDINKKITEMKTKKEIEFFYSPCLLDKFKEVFLYQYLFCLVESNLLASLSATEWVVLRVPHYYRNEREKLQDFEKLDLKKELLPLK
ncbi:competence protein [Desemzia sp. RIT804]|uniref:competence protein CoiA n=1 Tax=Desemzia sp. RIT 804 TaxID=2810209 RepID=UPI00194E3FAE|nr:competence protein CoiA family protein [Desemzia sp. RIT 804]MBM6613459.1 competence protein [Desemzia sp. RIT 804]